MATVVTGSVSSYNTCAVSLDAAGFSGSSLGVEMWILY